jgi:hypothetical protein
MEYQRLSNPELIAIAAKALAGDDGMNKFTRRDIIRYVNFTLLKDSPNKRNEQSLNPMIQALTVNALGGSLGGGKYRKRLLWRVARGFMMLYNSRIHRAGEIVEEMKPPLKPAKAAEAKPRRPINSESKVRDFLLQILYYNLGEKETWRTTETTKGFKVDSKYGDLECVSEGSLRYTLPPGNAISHKSDILFKDKKDEHHFSIEIKHRSAVTDQFKCRSYDIIHLKQCYPKLCGIMVYVKSDKGISPRHAKSICYPFDYFFSIPESEIYNPEKWEPLLSRIQEQLAGS